MHWNVSDFLSSRQWIQHRCIFTTCCIQLHSFFLRCVFVKLHFFLLSSIILFFLSFCLSVYISIFPSLRSTSFLSPFLLPILSPFLPSPLHFSFLHHSLLPFLPPLLLIFQISIQSNRVNYGIPCISVFIDNLPHSPPPFLLLVAHSPRTPFMSLALCYVFFTPTELFLKT